MHVWVSGLPGGFEDGMSDPLYLAFRSSDVRNVLNHFSHVVSQRTLPFHNVDALGLIFCAVGRICVIDGVNPAGVISFV